LAENKKALKNGENTVILYSIMRPQTSSLPVRTQLKPPLKPQVPLHLPRPLEPLSGNPRHDREHQKGRGAGLNLQGRFEEAQREGFHDGWDLPEASVGPRKTVIHIEPVRSTLVFNQSPDLGFDRSINTYRGCEHGCIYCYARPNHGYVGLSPGLDFETQIFAKADAAKVLRQELSKPGYRCAPVNLGSSTDAYQPAERGLGITRQVLEVLEQCNHPLSIVTKSWLIERDIDILSRMAKRNLVAVYVSITSLDAELSRKMEPRAAAPWRRLETLRRLSQAGIPTSVSLAPVIPFINEPEIEKILHAAKEAGARGANYIVVRLPWEVKTLFRDWLLEHFPDRADRVMQRIQDMRGGKDNDSRFSTRMKGEGLWAQLIRMRFDTTAKHLGMWRQRFNLDHSQFDPRELRQQLGANQGSQAAGGQAELF
jgi:DNA repair photolyase